MKKTALVAPASDENGLSITSDQTQFDFFGLEHSLRPSCPSAFFLKPRGI